VAAAEKRSPLISETELNPYSVTPLLPLLQRNTISVGFWSDQYTWPNVFLESRGQR